MTIPSPTAQTGFERLRVRLLAVATAVLIVFALRETRDVTMPLALGLSLAVLAWPVMRWVSARAPRWLGLLAAVLTIVLAMAGAFALLGWSADLLMDRGSRYQDRIAERRSQLGTFAARLGIEAPGAGSAQQGTDSGGSGAASSSTRRDFAYNAGVALYRSLGSLALATGFAALALAEVHAVRSRVRSRFRPERAEKMLAISNEVTDAVRHYFAVKTLTSFITGAATGLFTLAVGLDLAAVWALIAFLLEYVPSVGSVIAVIPPATFAFLQFDSIATPIGIAAGLMVLQLVLGNYVDPKIEGMRMSVSPLVILLSIIFWAWVWGPFGALLGVPVTIALTTVARHFPGTRPVWAMLTEAEHPGDSAGQE